MSILDPEKDFEQLIGFAADQLATQVFPSLMVSLGTLLKSKKLTVTATASVSVVVDERPEQ